MSDDTIRFPLVVDLYEQYLVDQDSPRFVRKVSEHYTIGTLERLAEWGERMARRGGVLALGMLADYTSNPVLGRALLDGDRGVRTLAEAGIRKLWFRIGDERTRRQLDALHRLNESKQFQECIEKATILVQDSPWLAESWNQRGIAHFYREEYEQSIRDCHQTLEINPYHFAAAAGMGKSYLRLGNRVAALEAFRRALRLNPGLDDVRAQVIHLQRTLQEED